MSKIVMPGEVISDKPIQMPYTYNDGNKTYATVVSLLSDSNKIIPLEGPYEPLENDSVIGYVKDVRFTGYDVDIQSAQGSFLSTRNTRANFKLTDIIMARVLKVDEIRSIDLGDGRALKNGHLEKISAVKVPRLIGKRNSMINMIIDATGCIIEVGRNGLIFVSNTGNYELAKKAIDMVEQQAHVSGLTDKMAKYLSEQTKKEIKPQPVDAPVRNDNYSNNSRPAYRPHNNSRFGGSHDRKFRQR